MDAFSVVTEESWFDRIIDSIKGVLTGFGMLALAFPLLWMNESCSVERANSLESGAKQVVTVPADKVDASHDGQLVHMVGMTVTGEKLVDEDFGVSEDAIKLSRTVETFQWIEHVKEKKKKKLGGKKVVTTTYTYKQEWDEGISDSTEFEEPEGHENPDDAAYRSEDNRADDVKVGAFALPGEMIRKLNNYQDLPATQAMLDSVHDEKPEVRLHGDVFYSGDDPQHPAIGDFRVSFRVVRPETVSAVAQQSGESLVSHEMKEGSSIALITTGEKTSAQMFTAALEANTRWTWIMRGLGFFMMLFGLALIFSPIVVIADVVPFFGDLLGAGVWLFAGALAFTLSFVTIAVAWIAVRPMVGIPLLGAGLATVIGLYIIGRSAKKKRVAAKLETAAQPG